VLEVLEEVPESHLKFHEKEEEEPQSGGLGLELELFVDVAHLGLVLRQLNPGLSPLRHHPLVGGAQLLLVELSQLFLALLLLFEPRNRFVDYVETDPVYLIVVDVVGLLLLPPPLAQLLQSLDVVLSIPLGDLELLPEPLT
jgi:hypothetical protein